MPKICEVTGKKTMRGNKVSHSNNKSKRNFYVNLFKKKFFVPQKKSWITIKISASGIKILNKIGIEKFLKNKKNLCIKNV